MILFRVLAIIVGLGAIAAVTYGTVEATGGVGTNAAPLYIALGALQAAIALSFAVIESRAVAALAILVLLACEAASFIGTADLQLAGIETAAAPIHEAVAKRKSAEEWLARLERDDRVQGAEQALRDAQADARAKSTAPDCGKGCIATLNKTVDGATAAVGQARESLQLEHQQARAALAAAPLPPQASPLAARLGMEPGTVDLLFVGFRGFAVAAGAAIVLAVGAHARKRTEIEPPAKQDDAPSPPKIARFLIDSVERAPRSRVESAELYEAYQGWCRNNNALALPAPQFADALVPVLDAVGVKRMSRGDDVFLVGVKLAS